MNISQILEPISFFRTRPSNASSRSTISLTYTGSPCLPVLYCCRRLPTKSLGSEAYWDVLSRRSPQFELSSPSIPHSTGISQDGIPDHLPRAEYPNRHPGSRYRNHTNTLEYLHVFINHHGLHRYDRRRRTREAMGSSRWYSLARAHNGRFRQRRKVSMEPQICDRAMVRRTGD